jgi:TolB protein
VVGGSFLRLAGDRFEIKYRLQLSDEKTAWGVTLEGNSAFVRFAAHKIADQIYEKLTGEKGDISTRVTYVSKEKSQFKLHVADWDGANAQVALSSVHPIISPRWSPECNRIAYISLESGMPQLFVHDISNERRTKVADFFGSNSAPTWHPDGKTLAVVLTIEGESKIYLIDADGGGTPRRLLSQMDSIETEPEFHPDGASIWFTSERRGRKPQIYRLVISSGQLTPIVLDGSYNGGLRVSKDGRRLAYILRGETPSQIVVRNLETDTETVLSNGTDADQSPSFSPSGRQVLFTSRSAANTNELYAVKIENHANRFKVLSPYADIRDPDWCPNPF